MNLNYISGFIISFFVALLFTPIIIRLARRYSLVDSPQRRSHPAQVHTGSVPRAGGLALAIAFILTTIFMVAVNKAVLGILTAVLLTLIIGILDDIKESNPYSRFVANLFVAAIIVAAGIGIPFVTNPFNGVWHLDAIRWKITVAGRFYSILPLADLAAIIWIVWTMNIVGWSGGIDGQLPGFVTIAAFVIGLLSFRFSAHDISQTQVALLSFITAGCFAGFLPWNFYPQKIMPGYSGKSLAGLLLATLSILSGAKLGTALLVLSIPMTDAVFTLIRRLAAGRSPFWADRGHLHHKLLERGWGKRRIAVFYWFTSAVFGILALTLTSTLGKFFAVAVIVTFTLMILSWLHLFARKTTTLQPSARNGKKSNLARLPYTRF